MEMNTLKKSVNNYGSKLQRHMKTVIFIAFMVTFLVVTRYTLTEGERQVLLTKKHLAEITYQNTALIRNVFDNYVETLRALAVRLKNVDDLKSPETLELLESMADAFGFKRLSVDFPNGKSYTTDRIILDLTDPEYLDKIKSGQVFITDVTPASTDGTPVVRIQVPLIKDGIPAAALSYSIELDDLSNEIAEGLPGMKGYFYIVDEKGNFVSETSPQSFQEDLNFFDMLDILVYERGYSKELILKSFTESKSGNAVYILDGTTRYAYYAPVGINNWVMLTVIPQDIVDADANAFIIRSLLLSLKITLILTAVSLTVYYNQKRLREEAELDQECFQILSEHTGKVVLEWDYNKQALIYPNFEKLVGRKPMFSELKSPEEAIDAGEVFEEDHAIFRKMFKDLSNGCNVEIPRIRLKLADGTLQYYSISTTVIFDTNGKPYKSIGFLENIDNQVRKVERLRRRAETDQLTGMYNKAAAERMISEIIGASDDETLHAFICADLDNFKSINDEFGHLYGDEVLKELSESIGRVFRKSDVLGRFGGDEFVIFVTDIPSESFIEEKAIELNKQLCKAYSKDGIECVVSASIGIAIYPADGKTYAELYENADEASYRVKNLTKNSYAFAGGM